MSEPAIINITEFKRLIDSERDSGKYYHVPEFETTYNLIYLFFDFLEKHGIWNEYFTEMYNDLKLSVEEQIRFFIFEQQVFNWTKAAFFWQFSKREKMFNDESFWVDIDISWEETVHEFLN